MMRVTQMLHESGQSLQDEGATSLVKSWNGLMVVMAAESEVLAEAT
jgi:hypothetical protein